MMRRLLSLLLAGVFCMRLLILPTYADFTDDCAAAQSDGWHMYQGLSATPGGPAVDFDWPTAPDRSALGVTSPQSGAAHALYAVENASGVQVSLYSIYSTFATVSGGVPAPGYPVGGSAARARRLLLTGDGRVCLKENGWWVLERDAYGELVFAPLSSAPGGALNAYGLTVACSADGRSFAPVPVSLSAAHNAREERPSFSCYYESYSAAVPPGTRFVRVELREISFFPLASGGTAPNSTRGSMRLASVTFTGSAVRGSLAGEPPPSEAPAPSGDSSPAPPTSSSGSEPDPDIETAPPYSNGTGAGSAEKKRPARSSSQSSSRRSYASSRSSSRVAGASSGAARAPSSKSSAAPKAAPAPSRGEPAPEPVPRTEYVAPAHQEDSRTLLLGGGYLVFAAAVLTFLARRGGR